MPAAFFGSTIAANVAGNSLTVLTPSRARRGDVLFFVGASASSSSIATPVGWQRFVYMGDPGTAVTFLFRRVVQDGEPAQHVFALSPATSNAVGAALLYRGTDSNAALVGARVTAYDTSGTSETAPTVTLAKPTDFVINMFVSTGVDSPTPSIGVVRARAPSAGNYALVVSEQRPGAAGDSPTASIAWAGTARKVAASFGLAVLPPIVAPYANPDVPGAIGFVTVGV